MTERRDAAGEEALLEEVLTGSAPDPELLVRYSDDPDSLTPEQRSEIEAQLAASPRAADALRTLEGFDPARFAQPAGPGLLERLREWWSAGQARFWVPAAAAAALVAAVLLLPERATPPGETVAEGPETPQTPPVDPSPVDPEPVNPEPTAGPEPALETPDPDPEPLRPAPIVVVQGPEPVAPPPPEEPEPEAPTPVIEDAPIYVAMLEPRYASPTPYDARPRLDSFVRGAAGPGRVVALAPEHVAHTSLAAPVLLWWTERVPATGRWWLAVTDPESFEVVARVPLAPPTQSGVQATRLSEHGIELEPGRAYLWTVLHRVEADDPSQDVAGQAWVRRVAAVPALDAAPPHARAAGYAEAGLWYDALREVDALHRRFPTEREPVRALERLLEGAGLGDLEIGDW